jgi:hypothetical protein
MWQLQSESATQEPASFALLDARYAAAMFCPKEAHDTIANMESLTPLGRYDQTITKKAQKRHTDTYLPSFDSLRKRLNQKG